MQFERNYRASPIDNLSRTLAKVMDEAIAKYVSPECVNALLGSLSMVGKKQEKAAALTAERLVAQCPGYVRAYHIAGLLQVYAQNPADAIPWYEKALTLDPRNAEVLYSMGSAYKVMGEFGQAVSAFRECLRSDPQYAGAHLNLGWLHSTLSEYAAAAPHYEVAMKTMADDAQLNYNLGECYFHMRRFDEARPLLRKAQDLFMRERNLFAAGRVKYYLKKLP
jgi:tetratricopeptide (TPR) repeat protein